MARLLSLLRQRTHIRRWLLTSNHLGNEIGRGKIGDVEKQDIKECGAISGIQEEKKKKNVVVSCRHVLYGISHTAKCHPSWDVMSSVYIHEEQPETAVNLNGGCP